MNDVLRPCHTCGGEHPWGITGYSKDNVPLYGPRATADCTDFRPQVEELPAGVNGQELMAATGDLDAQASVQTRLVVSRIRELGKAEPRYARMAAQWPEFMNFVIAEITAMRGALTRDESKFGLLISHTDEIVEAMRNVTQLAERLQVLNNRVVTVQQTLDELRADRRIKYSAEYEAYQHFGLLPEFRPEHLTTPAVELDDPQTPPLSVGRATKLLDEFLPEETKQFAKVVEGYSDIFRQLKDYAKRHGEDDEEPEPDDDDEGE